jgi:hypothetical protein
MSEFRHVVRIAHREDLPHSGQQIHQEKINRARQAAEALFKPKRPTKEAAAPVFTPSIDPAHKPRILQSVAAEPSIANEIHLPPDRETRTRAHQIPAVHLTRIRTWLKYGMTVRQAAKVCGVSVSEIERVLQQA